MTELIVTSSVLISVVAGVRHFFKGKISLRLQYALWAMVLMRLLMPFSLTASPISVMNIIENTAAISDDIGVLKNQRSAPEPKLSLEFDEPEIPSGRNDAELSMPHKLKDADIGARDWTKTIAIIWYSGIAAVGLVLLFSNISFWRKLRRTRKEYVVSDCALPVYVVDALPSPCIFGIFRTAVYITPETLESETKLRHVLAHELTHYRHGDHIWSLLRGVCLAVHWYNPLVWLAGILSRRDAELACDEGTIKKIGEESRIEYGRTLIGLSIERHSAMDLLCCATTMVSGEKGIKERIMLIAKKPKMLMTTLAAVLIIAVFTAGCTFTGAASGSVPAELGIIMEGVNVPDSVLDAAKEQVGEYFEMSKEEFPGYKYTNWRIEALEWVYSYDEADGKKLDIYRMNYEFLSEAPENIMMAGRMYITEDNWVCPIYPNCTYLVIDAREDKYLFAMMENDCVPGDEIFTTDMKRRLADYTPTTGESIDTDQLAVSGLSNDTNIGIGVFLDYADDDIVIFHGYFGLFVYDLKAREIVFSMDLKKSVGTTNIEGSEGAAVRVSADGSVIQLYHYPEKFSPQNAYYIRTSDFTCTYGTYRELESCFSIDEYGSVEFADGTRGEINLGGSHGIAGTISALSYKRGNDEYALFEY